MVRRQNVTPEPLTDTDFESLANVLQRFGGKGAMNIEQLDGYLAAIVCHPADIPKTEYLSEIWGDEMINEERFAAQPMLQDFLSLVSRHKDAIAHTLQSRDPFNPRAFGGLRWCLSCQRVGVRFCPRDEAEKGRLDCALRGRGSWRFACRNLCFGT
jgi:Uncharacterised protein family (UPF0149)